MKDPIQGSGLCGCLSRIYKHLNPAYFEEFSNTLKQYLLQNCRLVPVDESEQASHQKRVSGLLDLYGTDALPAELIDVYNICLEAPTHAHHQHDANQDLPQVRGQFLLAIQKHILRVDEHPVVTRFWTFTTCVLCLLRLYIFNLPQSILSVSTTSRKEQQKRLQRVKKYMEQPHAEDDVRVAALTLRLTTFCTNLVSKKKSAGCSGEVLIQLGQGKVQERAGELASNLLRHLQAGSEALS